jgi:hydroxyethylthiazole kinase-like uncharacterized protein yjeF
MTSRPILTADETRAAEQAVFATGVTVEAVMERAGAAVAEATWRFGGHHPVLVLCGPGNNGGDGYVVARVLRERGLAVRIAATGEPRTDAARFMRGKWDGPVEALADAEPAYVLVDALFGTGLARSLDPAVAEPFERLAQAATRRIAVDLPSGVGTDDGALLGPPISFDVTVALGTLKPAHRLQPAVSLMGYVVVADIGLSLTSDLHEIAQPHLPKPGPADHKYTRGHVVVAGGAMPGASLLSAMAAQRSGAGYVTLVGDGASGPASIVHKNTDLASVLQDDRVGAVVIGPGLGRDRTGRNLLDKALLGGRPLVLDADALMLLGGGGLGRLSRLPTLPILTPHDGEFTSLFGDLPGSRIDRARAAAKRARAVVILKGPDTIVAAPDGRAAIGAPAPSWLASAGTGDVLAGITGACLARGLDPFDAACAAIWLHAEAARRAGPALIADDLIGHLSSVLGSCG